VRTVLRFFFGLVELGIAMAILAVVSLLIAISALAFLLAHIPWWSI